MTNSRLASHNTLGIFLRVRCLQLACEPQTHFRSSLLSLRKIAIFRRERGDDRKCVCGSQASLQPAKSTKMASGEGSRKPWKHNFSASEISILTEKVEENLAILQSKFTNSVTNLKKKQVWSEITAAVNAVGVDKPDKRTETEVREKWKNLHSAAKREFTKFCQESKKTGGGPAPKEISATTSKVIELFQDTPSFVGLAGSQVTQAL